METIDDSICSGIERGDERTWAAFYAAFAPVMRAYAVRRGCDEPDDAVQDVFVKFVAAVRAGRFKAHSAAETVSYMKTQVARQVIDYHRRANARCRDAMVEFDEFAISLPADAPRIVEAREEAAIRVRAREKASAGWRCSDRTRGVFVVPSMEYVRLVPPPKQVSDAKNDHTYYSLLRFCELMAGANPTTMEMLYLPEDCIITATPAFETLVAHRDMFITRRAVESHLGYAVSQMKKAKGAKKRVWNPWPEEPPMPEE